MALFRPPWRALHGALEKKSRYVRLVVILWLLLAVVQLSRRQFSSGDECVCDPQDRHCICVDGVCYKIWKRQKKDAWHEELVLQDLSKIGEGGFGEVYEGKELCGDQEMTFILKKVPTIHREEWHREVYFGQLLEGKPYVARYVRSGEDKGALWIIFRHEGKSLYELMHERWSGVAVGRSEWWIQLRKDPRRWLTIVRQLCQALVVLKENQVIHRDIKPENILLNDNDELRLIDFGSAIDEMSFSEFYKKEPASHLQETPAYTPPEAWLNKQRYAQSFPFDMWSAGMVLLELKPGNLDCLEPTREQAAALKGKENELSNPRVKENIHKLLGLLNICPDFFSHHDELKAYFPSTMKGCAVERLKNHLKQYDDQKEGPTDKEVEFFLKVFQYDLSSRITAQQAVEFWS